MKFFIPHVDDEQKAAQVWHAVRAFAAENVRQTTERRIQAISWNHAGKTHHAAVGENEPYERQQVLCILECIDGLCLICTWERGVKRGIPILVGKQELVSIVDFDPSDA